MIIKINEYDNEDEGYYDYELDSSIFSKELIRYIFTGETYITNIFTGKLLKWFKTQNSKTACIFNAAVVFDGIENYIQMNAINKNDKVLFRVRFYV